MKLYGIVGIGGFGREVMPLASALLRASLRETDYELVFIDQKNDNKVINKHNVMNNDEFLAHPASEKFFNIAIASSESRKKVADELCQQGARPFRINAPNHVELGPNDIGEGAIFCSHTIVTANAKIGHYFHANIYSYIAHDCIIGDYVTFAPNVHCNGNVIIEDHAYIGTGVIIKQGTQEQPIVIGKGAVIGMGAVVTKSVPAYETVVGNPARPLAKK